MILIVAFISLISSLWLGTGFAMKQRQNRFLRLPSGITVVFAGDSNVESAIDDGRIRNSINIARSAEPYFYSFYKLKALLTANPQIKIVFLGYAFHDIDVVTEKRWMFRDDCVIHNLKSENYLMDGQGNFLIIKENPKAFLLGIRAAIGFNLRGIARSFIPGKNDIRRFLSGAYGFLEENKLTEDSKVFLGEAHKYEKAGLQIEYLGKISELCKARSVRVVLLNTPKHPFYLERIGTLQKNDLASIPKTGTGFDSILDYSGYPLPDSCFGDLMHLNYQGARRFSDFLDTVLMASY
jgi:hypothetical protein